jgi:protein-tyrosine phosphatase
MGSVVTALGLDASVHFGRRRGWALHHLWSLARYLGLFRRMERIDWVRVNRLVFICRGNICRSAYAEQRARAVGFPAASFGLQARQGRKADPTAIEIARRRGVDLRGHRARSWTGFFPQIGDLLVAMEPRQLLPLMKMARIPDTQVTLLGLWSSPARPYLQDPYGLGTDYFHTCFGSIDSAMKNIRERFSLAALSRVDSL